MYDPTEAGPTEATNVRIAFGRERDDREKAGRGEDDWKCDVVGLLLFLDSSHFNIWQCFLPNFSHRTFCFRCNAPRTREYSSLFNSAF